VHAVGHVKRPSARGSRRTLHRRPDVGAVIVIGAVLAIVLMIVLT
jgi:hypothetical protein